MVNPHWLELPISRTNFHSPKDVRAVEVRLYFEQMISIKEDLGNKEHTKNESQNLGFIEARHMTAT